jgi:transcriptional regulator with XRE-family HTH domain
MSASSKLHLWRAKKALSLVEAGKLLGISASTLCDYENGKKQPRIGVALRIAKLTKVRIEEWAAPAESGPLPVDPDQGHTGTDD